MPWMPLDPATAVVTPTTTVGAPKTSIGETLLTLRTDLTTSLAKRADVNSIKANSWINKAYRHFCAMLPLPELEASFSWDLVVGEPFYLLPRTATGSVVLAAIYQANIIDDSTYASGGIPLTFTDKTDYRRLPDRDGEPTAFFRYLTMAGFWPTPTNVRTVVFEGKIRPAPLVLDTDSPLFPEEFHEGVYLLARAKALRDLREYKESALAQNDFVSFIRPIQDNLAEEKSHQDTRITPIRNRRDLLRHGSLGSQEEW